MSDEHKNDANQSGTFYNGKGLIRRKSKNLLELNSEGVVFQYLRGNGFVVNSGKLISDENGVPDFMVEKDGEKFWVEVKRDTFSLSNSQVNWIINHTGEKTYLAAVSGKFVSFYELQLIEAKL